MIDEVCDYNLRARPVVHRVLEQCFASKNVIYTMPGSATVFNSYLHPGIRGKIGSCNYLNEWQQRQKRLVPSDIMFSAQCSPSRNILSPLFHPTSLFSHTIFLSPLYLKTSLDAETVSFAITLWRTVRLTLK